MQPYCGAVGVSQGSTVLFTNGSSAHSETSWLSPWMSCSAQSVPPFGRAKMPGDRYDAQANVCTDALPFEPVFCVVAPWKPITQQLKTFCPMWSRTSSVR